MSSGSPTVPAKALLVLVAVLVLLQSARAPYAQTVAIDPLANISQYGSLPIGIASYGLYNISADSGPYSVSTNEVVGLASIYGMLAYNSSLASQQNLSDYGATLQLNVVANVTAAGRRYVYWMQNVADFNTSNSTYYFVDNVWNLTTGTANVSNATLVGSGSIYPSSYSLQNGTILNQTFYSYAQASDTKYFYPLTLVPVIELARNGNYPLVRMGYGAGGNYSFYDNITINVPGGNASIIVTPYEQTPYVGAPQNGSYYDAELVFGSEANGTTTTYRAMNATLWLGYMGPGGLRPFPSLATFALDTAESAIGIGVSQGDDYGDVHLGAPSYNTTIHLFGVPPVLDGIAQYQPAFVTNTTVTTVNYTLVYPVPQAPQASAWWQSVYTIAALLALAILVYVLYRRAHGAQLGLKSKS